MAVIINEFEIVTDENRTADLPRGDMDAAPPQAMPALKPVDIEAIVEHQAERDTRLRAH